MAGSPIEFFHGLPLSLFRSHNGFPPAESMSRHDRAKLLCFTSLGLLLTMIGINTVENSHELLPALVVTAVIVCAMLAALFFFHCSLLVLLGTALALLSLASYLILNGSAATYGSLFWLILFPPILLFCLGLRLGTRLVAGFLLWISVLFIIPLPQEMSPALPAALRVRFLGSLFGSFFFAWFVEHSSCKAQSAFLQAARLLERHALTDPLTSLGNRRDFENHFRSTQALAVRSGRCFSVALADIDHFKRVNDNYGHAVGDLVLCHIAAVLAANLRQGDMVFRWGGEEFVILMPDTYLADSLPCAERLRVSVEAAPYEGAGGLSLPITISLGVFCGEPARAMSDCLAEADLRLYLAKKGGRNRVEGRAQA